ncbi:MAG: UDP-glucose/GDP-mannose dehydrogenase family protein [Helicobacteraceae bacterium]|jgi:UDPglucose 6-dehydrogenase|nr:UDP-glucose/GDP-mannose dehydrogenase family protein [Helicobacteraceae bacterium]
MRLTMIGTGYVGLVTGACFAEMGNSVICADIDADKIDRLSQGIVPIYEPGLETLVHDNAARGTLRFTTELRSAIVSSDIVFIAVGTPQDEDGSADLSYVLSAAKTIGECMTRSLIVVDKSTVPVGTADKVRETISAALALRGVDIAFSVVSNPEFLKEGAAIEDFSKPDRIVIGADNPKALDVMRELYVPFTHSHDRFIAMDIRSAEMTKYAANAMLATKISFINEIAAICEKVGADVNKVRVGIGSDRRIGYSFIYPGCGYGGSCFPKDVKALEKTALENGVTPRLISAVELVNARQKTVLEEKIVARFGGELGGLRFAIWGLSFKPETDDMRQAPSVTLIEALLKRGASVSAYDPKAMTEARRHCGNTIDYAANKYDALNGADALVLVTEWKEFRSPDFDEVKQRLKKPIVFDGRNQFSAVLLAGIGFEHYPIGVATSGIEHYPSAPTIPPQE